MASPGACAANAAPALEVRIDGFKQRQGRLRIRLYDSVDTFLKRGAKVSSIKLPVPATGAASACFRLAKTGNYAVVVRHDLNGNRHSDLGDGGGASRNPHVTVWRPRPKFEDVALSVGSAITHVRITLQYLTNGVVAPVAVTR